MKRFVHHHAYIGSMVKLVNTLDSKSSAARLLGSSPSTPTIFLRPSLWLSDHLKIGVKISVGDVRMVDIVQGQIDAGVIDSINNICMRAIIRHR